MFRLCLAVDQISPIKIAFPINPFASSHGSEDNKIGVLCFKPPYVLLELFKQIAFRCLGLFVCSVKILPFAAEFSLQNE